VVDKKKSIPLFQEKTMFQIKAIFWLIVDTFFGQPGPASDEEM
jgi:hypothetical protein